jgi:hypothetical protein
MFTKNAHPLHKVTIIPRGGSLGHVKYIQFCGFFHLLILDLPITGKGSTSADEGTNVGGHGRLHGRSSGRRVDIWRGKHHNGSKRRLKKSNGAGRKYGQNVWDERSSWAQVYIFFFEIFSKYFCLRDFTSPVRDQELGAFGRGPHTSNEIDEEIKRVLAESYERAKQLLINHKVGGGIGPLLNNVNLIF